MKKMRYIPIVALAALLSSCSLGGMKAPSFAKEGDEVNYEKFFGKLDDAEEKSELSDKDSELGDRILKASDSTSQTTIWKRGKKELEKEVVQSISKGESQFDYSSHVAKMTAEIKGTDKETAQEGTYNITANAKQEQYYQFEKIEGVKYLALVNAKTQQYRGYYPVVEPMKEDDVFDQVVRSTIMNASYYFENYMPYSEEEAKKDYLFYINDNVFTYTANKEDTNKDNENYTVTTTVKIKAQLDYTDKKQAVRVSYESKTEKEYKKDYDGCLDGDIVTTEVKHYVDYSVSAKDVKLKEIDVSDYYCYK